MNDTAMNDAERQIIIDACYEPASWDIVRMRAGVLVAKHHSEPQYLKVFFDNNIRYRLSYYLGLSKAKRAAIGTKHLDNIGINAPMILECNDSQRISSILMEGISGVGVHNYMSWLSEHKAKYADLQNAIFTELGTLIAHMHNQGVQHGDLRPNNILLHSHEGTMQCSLIDNDRTRKAFRPQRESIRNLMQIMMMSDHILNKDARSIFFDAYAQRRNISPKLSAFYQNKALTRTYKRLRPHQQIQYWEGTTLYHQLAESKVGSFVQQ